MAGQAIDVTDQGFEEEVLKADKLVMVDFWAPWCGPCRMVSPVPEEVAEENAETLKLCKINVDENTQAAAEHAIMSIPTVMFFKNGEKLGDRTLIGAKPKADYQKVIDELAD